MQWPSESKAACCDKPEVSPGDGRRDGNEEYIVFGVGIEDEHWKTRLADKSCSSLQGNSLISGASSSTVRISRTEDTVYTVGSIYSTCNYYRMALTVSLANVVGLARWL